MPPLLLLLPVAAAEQHVHKPAPQGVCSETDFCTGHVGPDPTHQDGRSAAWIPPPAHNNHASFLHELPDGDLGLVFFSGTEEGQFNCSVYYARLPRGEKQWSTPQLISRRCLLRPIYRPMAFFVLMGLSLSLCWIHTPGSRYDWSNENPNLMTDPATGWLIAHHSSQPASNCVGDPTNSGHNGPPCCPANTLLSPGPSTSCEHYAEIWRVVSKDGKGETWEPPVPFLRTPSSFSRNRPIQLSGSGEWLFPMFYAQGTFSPRSDAECLGWPAIQADYAGLWRSPPNEPISFHWSELSWMNETTKAVYPGFPTSGCRVHPSIVDLGDGHLKVFFRDRRMENIYSADSFDNGTQPS